MKVNIDYKREPEMVEKNSNQYLTRDYIVFAVNDVHKNGLEGQMRRMFGRLHRKLDDAVDKNVEEVEFENAEKDFLKNVFEKAQFPANLAKYVIILEDELEADRKAAEPK